MRNKFGAFKHLTSFVSCPSCVHRKVIPSQSAFPPACNAVTRRSQWPVLNRRKLYDILEEVSTLIGGISEAI